MKRGMKKKKYLVNVKVCKEYVNVVMSLKGISYWHERLFVSCNKIFA
jgi:hypothetical protein